MTDEELFKKVIYKNKIEDYILSLRFQDEPNWNPEYYKGFNDALTEVLEYVSKM